MKTNLLLFVSLVLLSNNMSAQQDTIINYYKAFHELCNSEDAMTIEKEYQDLDGNWRWEKLSKNWKPLEIISYQSRKKEVKNGYYCRFSSFYWYDENADPNKNRHEDGYYENNQKTGRWLTYGFDGFVEEEMFYRAGKLVGTYKKWCENGELTESGVYLDGVKDGKWEGWDCETQKKTFEQNYKHGLLDGIWLKWDSETLVDSGMYVEDVREGKWKYEKNNTHYKCYYKNGKWDSEFVCWYPPDVLSERGFYENGIEVGEWQFYHLNGQLAGELTFTEGKVTDAHFWDEDGNPMDQTEVQSTEPFFRDQPEDIYHWLQYNLEYPEEARKAGVEGTVYVQFKVTLDGSIWDIHIKESPDKILSDEVMRLMKIMPDWHPAMYHTKPINAIYTLPIYFRL